ncbi:MAG: alpha/beta hydrolase [Desulfobacteraceae bacterium]|nr:MAG: alpha/beta hydrolase [Desulfobacteraceae bacterium]
MRRLFFVLVFILLWTDAAVAQSRVISLNASSTRAGVRVYRDLEYVQNGHPRQKLDLYVPEKAEGPLPLIVWIHGGAWKHGSKSGCLPLPWAGKGYVVASIGYRLCQDALFPAQIEDCKAAVRWLRRHAEIYKIDPDRVVAWGGSAGGHLASLLGTSADSAEWEQGEPAGSSRVQAVIDWYGRADLTPVCTDPSWADSPTADLLGGSGRAVSDLARKASPILHVSKDDPPFLIMHGDKDELVPLNQSRKFATALKEAGVAANLVVLRGSGHGGDEFLSPSHVKTIDAFLKRSLNSRTQP